MVPVPALLTVLRYLGCSSILPAPIGPEGAAGPCCALPLFLTSSYVTNASGKGRSCLCGEEEV